MSDEPLQRPDPLVLAQAILTQGLARSIINGMPVSFAYQLACDILADLANRTAKATAPADVVFALRMSRAMVEAANVESTNAQREASTGLVIAAADSRVNGKRIVAP